MIKEAVLKRNAKIVVKFIAKFIGSSLVIAMLSWAGTYPFGWANCKSYGYAKEIPTKYVYFQCYVKTPEGVWLTKEEYQSSQIGAKLLIKVD